MLVDRDNIWSQLVFSIRLRLSSPTTRLEHDAGHSARHVSSEAVLSSAASLIRAEIQFGRKKRSKWSTYPDDGGESEEQHSRERHLKRTYISKIEDKKKTDKEPCANRAH